MIAAADIDLAYVERGELRAGAPAGALFQAASIAKCLTAWALGRLWERGQIDLDAPLGRYVPEHAVQATVRQALSHTAGLSHPDIAPCMPGAPRVPPEVRSVGPIGEFHYSGGGYALLERAIEEVSGEPFARHMARNVLEPLGMLRSTFDQDSALLDDAAVGHDAEGAELPFYRYAVPAAAGLFTTAHDLALFAAAHFSGRGVVTPRTIATLTTPVARTGHADGLWGEYALGYEVERALVGHHGMNPGWRALLAIEPARSRALVALADHESAMPRLEAMVSEWAAQ